MLSPTNIYFKIILELKKWADIPIGHFNNSYAWRYFYNSLVKHTTYN